MVFSTQDTLMASDQDPYEDVYVVRRGGPPPPGYPRPKGATPLLASLVLAYQPCAGPNHAHGPPLAFGSCSPPALESTQLTVGTADSNLQATASVGSARYDVLAGNAATVEDEADVKMTFSLTDVRRQVTLADYTGELRVSSSLRITDKMSGTGADPATSLDFDLAATIPCSATATAEGAECLLSTSFDALAPGTVTERRRSVWQLGQVRVHDGGPDGDADTAGDNGLFAVQGVFVP